MKNYQLKQDFENCVDHLIGSRYLFMALLNSIKQEASRSEIQDDTRQKLESNMHCTEKIINDLESILRESENISFEVPVKNIQKFENNLVIFPLYQDEDICVDMDDNIADFWKNDN